MSLLINSAISSSLRWFSILFGVALDALLGVMLVLSVGLDGVLAPSMLLEGVAAFLTGVPMLLSILAGVPMLLSILLGVPTFSFNRTLCESFSLLSDSI